MPWCTGRFAKQSLQTFGDFSYKLSKIELLPTDSFTFCIGKAPFLPLGGESYRVNITASGASIVADSQNSLICGFMTLIDRIRIERMNGESRLLFDALRVWRKTQIASAFSTFCVFPETELWELRRFIRFCAALRYTHVSSRILGHVSLRMP